MAPGVREQANQPSGQIVTDKRHTTIVLAVWKTGGNLSGM
jgi:hypothetical protein